MSLKKFLVHYAGEAARIASALGSITSGIALPNNERDNVVETIETLTNAAKSILDGIDKVTDPVVKISKADVEKILNPLIKDALKSHEARIRELEATIKELSKPNA